MDTAVLGLFRRVYQAHNSPSRGPLFRHSDMPEKQPEN
jgi:hypothetical protein